MTEYKTMRVPAEAWEAANDSKRESETWGEFLQRCSDNPPEIKEFVEVSDERTDEIAREVWRQADYAALSRSVADEVVEELR